MHEKQNRILKWVVVALAVLATYIATFDTTGNFAPSTQLDVVKYRFSYAIGNVAQDAEDGVVEQNYKMQKVVNGRHDLNDSRIERDRKHAQTK